MQVIKYILITISLFLSFAFIPQSLDGMLSDEILRSISQLKKETEGLTDSEKEIQKKYFGHERLKAPGSIMQQYLKTRAKERSVVNTSDLQELRLRVIQSLKNNIIKKIKDDPSKKTAIAIQGIRAAAASPNGKWIAIGTKYMDKIKDYFRMLSVTDSIIEAKPIYENYQVLERNIESLAFSPNSKYIAIGIFGREPQNNLLLYPVNNDGILEKEPQKLKIHNSTVHTIAFDSMDGKKMLSIGHDSNGIVVWDIDEHGNAQNPISLSSDKGFDTATFNSEGTILVAGKGHKLFIWYFNKHGIINQIPIKYSLPDSITRITNITFMQNTKKCIVSCKNEQANSGLIICDLLDDNDIKYKIAESYPSNECRSAQVSADGSMIIACNDAGLYLLAINNDDTISLIGEVPEKGTQRLVFSQDPNKIIFFGLGSLYSYTLLTEQERKILNSLSNLNKLQLSLLDKTLQGIKDIPLMPLIPHNIVTLLQNLGLISSSLAKPIIPMSFDQLIKEFEYFDSLSSPSEDVLETKKNLSHKIAIICLQMDIESLMKNKKRLLKLDPTVPEVQSLFTRLNAPYMKITGKDKAMGKDEEIIYIPEDILEMSGTLKNIKDDLAGGVIPKINIPIERYSSSTIAKVRDIINKKLSLEGFSLNELDELIEITNCANHLAFKPKILQTFTNKIYSLCKPLSLKEIPEQLKNLYPEALRPYVIQLFKNTIIKKSIKDPKTIQLNLQKYTTVKIGIPSPNNKMIAIGYGINNDTPGKNGFCIYKIDQEEIDKNQFPQMIERQAAVTHLAFSSNSKSILVGCDDSIENNLFLFKIKDEVVIDTEKPQVLKGHTKPITGVAFHPSGQVIVSIDASDTIFVRPIDLNNKIGTTPSFLDNNNIKEIKNLCFNHNGTLLICSGMKTGRGEGKAHYILVWEFDTNGELKDTSPIEHKISELVRILDIAWVPKTNKCFIGGNREGTNKAGLIWCDVSKKNLLVHKIENYEQNCSFVEVSPDGTIIIIGSNNNNNFDLFSIYNNDSIVLNHLGLLSKSPEDFLFTADSTQIINTWNGLHSIGGIKIQTLITPEEKNILELRELDSYPLLLIDKVLRKGKFDNELPRYLQENNIPEAIINQLRILSMPQEQPSIQPFQASEKKLFTEDASFISKLWNWMKARLPGSEQ